jgi:hypothetical protein
MKNRGTDPPRFPRVPESRSGLVSTSAVAKPQRSPAITLPAVLDKSTPYCSRQSDLPSRLRLPTSARTLSDPTLAPDHVIDFYTSTIRPKITPTSSANPSAPVPAPSKPYCRLCSSVPLVHISSFLSPFVPPFVSPSISSFVRLAICPDPSPSLYRYCPFPSLTVVTS